MGEGVSKRVVIILLVMVIIVSVFATVKVLDWFAVSPGNAPDKVTEANVRLTIVEPEGVPEDNIPTGEGEAT